MNYRNIISQLSACYDPGEARAITRMVLERRFALSWTDVLCGGIETMSEKDKAELTGIIGRIADGEPVQYVLGEAEFCARIFHVEPRDRGTDNAGIDIDLRLPAAIADYGYRHRLGMYCHKH